MKLIQITISGEAGSGKSTVADIIANKLKLKRYSTGDYMRTMAAAKGMTIIELNKMAETDQRIDKELDQWQIKLSRKNNELFIIDSRLGFHFIPHAVKVFLKADIMKRAERIFHTKRLTESNTTMRKTLADIKRRQALDRNRYIEKYNVDYLDFSNYDLVIDTSNIGPEKVAEKIINYVLKKVLRNHLLNKAPSRSNGQGKIKNLVSDKSKVYDNH